MCRTAYEAVKSIVSVVGGPMEQERTELFLKSVEIVDDQTTERAERLQESDSIGSRPKVR